jgi:type I restriction enzyme S subunit
MSDWREVSIEGLCVRVTSGGTPSRKRPDFYTDEGIPWVKSQELIEAKVSATEEHITDAGLKGSSAKLLPPDTVLMAMYGANVGQLGWLSIEATVNQAICAMVTNPDVTDPRFLYYALAGARGSLIAKAHGAAQQNLSQQLIKPFLLRVPDIDVQRKIGDVLRSIDDLIENSWRQVEALEEMARAIYREWFVKFRYPGHEGVSLVDSTLGPIPKGWEAKPLGKVANLVGGSATTKAAYVAAGHVAFSAAGPDGFLPDFEVDGDGVVLSAVGARCGRTFWASGKWSSIANTIKILPSEDDSMAVWLFLATENADIWPKRGSAQPFVSINDARAVRVVVADRLTHERFDAMARPLFGHADTLRSQAGRLVQIRGLLLPKLVTGKIDVSSLDFEAVVGDTVA